MKTKIRRALISVSDKSGIENLAHFLISSGIEILSTGGTAGFLSASGIKVIDVNNFTRFPEILEGRVKTLHPKVHGGILAKRDDKLHKKAIHDHGIEFIDLLVINLYPFESAVSSGASYEDCIEKIDIGGPALLRAGAKNYNYVTVISDPNDYAELITEIREGEGQVSNKFRQQKAAKAFGLTASYDASISQWFNLRCGNTMPERITFSGLLRHELRYGENPHQKGCFYQSNQHLLGVGAAKKLQGKDLSYNNLNDTDAAFELVNEFSNTPSCVIVKHANPCGVALGVDLLAAYEQALACDSESAFGGIIAFNRRVDKAVASKVIELYAEVVIAPDFDETAIEIFSSKKNIRLLQMGGMLETSQVNISMKTLYGGFLVQDRDSEVFANLNCVTQRKPSAQEMNDLKFAFTVAKHVKSNAIVYAKDQATVGIGAGQMSRVNSARIAAWKALDAATKAGDKESWAVGSVVASDAFFPFPDGLLAAAEAGVTAVIQPGGATRDKEIIKAADDAGLAMIFTGVRHFRH